MTPRAKTRLKIWLVVLGGSVYYLIAGVAMLAAAWFLFRGRLLGGWIYVGLFILSAIWGFAESRGNAWAMVPWYSCKPERAGRVQGRRRTPDTRQIRILSPGLSQDTAGVNAVDASIGLWCAGAFVAG